MTLRKIFVLLGFKTDKKSSKQANNAVKALKTAAKKLVAAFAVVKVAQFLKNTALGMTILADSIDKVSEKLGVNAQALQELRFAARLTGVEQRSLDVGLQRFIRRASEASTGTGEAVKAFQELGIRLKDTTGVMRPAEDILGDVAEGLKNTKNQSDRVRLAFKFFDTEGVALVNTLAQGRDALGEMRAEARELGGVLTNEDIKAGVEFRDTMLRLKFSFRAVQLSIMKALVPALKELALRTTRLIKENRTLFKILIVDVFGNIVRVAGSYIRALVAIIRATGEWIKNMNSIQRVLLVIMTTVLALSALFLLPQAPLIVLLALIGLILDDVLTWQAGGVSAIGKFIDAIDDLFDSLGWVGTALKELGKISSAFAETFRQMIFTLINLVVNLIQGKFLQAWKDLVANIKVLFRDGLFGWINEKLDALTEKIRALLPTSILNKVNDIDRRFFGIDRAAPGPSAARGPVSSSQVNTMKITVQAGPGMNEQQLAGAVGKAVDERLGAANRQALSALTNASTG